MTIQGFLDHVNSGEPVVPGTPAHMFMCELSQWALKITMELNSVYHTLEEIREMMSRLTGRTMEK